METTGTLLFDTRASWASCDLAAPARRAVMLDAFRVVVSGGLLVHFAQSFRDLPGLIGRDGLLPGRAFYEYGILAHVAVDATSLRVSSAAGALLALGMLVGAAPRVCAALLCVVALGLQRATFEITTLDQYLVAVAALWLCLLPVGHTLSIRGLRAASGRSEYPAGGTWRALRDRRVEGRSSVLCALHLMMVQLDVSLWRTFAPRWPESAGIDAVFLGVALALFAPSALLRVLAGVGISALHLALWLGGHTELQFAHLLLAALPLLLWSGATLAEGPAPPWNTASVWGALVLALTVVVRLSAVVPVAGESSARLLGELGLLPVASGQKTDGSLVLHMLSDTGERRTLDAAVLARGTRAGRALGYLASETAALASTREALARAVVERACSVRQARGESGTLVLSRATGIANVAWYDCGIAPDRVRVVMLRAAQPR